MKAKSVAAIHAALERGINVVDTAPVYGFGRSEEIVGKALAEQGLRSRAIIATKVGLEWRDGKVFRNASRGRIMRELEDSLRRLRTDYIDIYQVHWPDPLVPIEETAEAMGTLYRQGMIRAIGVSNFSVEQMERFRRVAPLHVLQSPYNLFERGIEAEILPYCRRNNIAVAGLWGALSRTALRPDAADTTFGGDDLRRNDPKFQQPRFAQYLAAVQRARPARPVPLRQAGHPPCGALDARPGHHVWRCGARAVPTSLQPVAEVAGWSLDADVKTGIDRILAERITDPVGPEFMAPPSRT